jgi:hypothetical protein
MLSFLRNVAAYGSDRFAALLASDTQDEENGSFEM